MAKNDVRQLNYTVDEINEGLKNSLEIGLQYSENKDLVQLVTGTDNKKVLGAITNPGAESGGLTLKYVDEKTLRIYNTNGSKNEEDWTPVGDEVLIISADPDAVSYKFDFTPVSTTEPQIFVKESVDKDIQNTQWQILYKIKQVDNKGNVMFDPVDVTWTIKVNNNTRTFKETINYTVSNLDETRSFNWIGAIYKDANFYNVGEYTIQGRFVGVDGIVSSRTWRVSLTSLTFGSSFSEEKIYREEQITIPYEVQGNMTKTISGMLVNKETLAEIDLGSIEHIASTYKQTGNFIAKDLKHGVYSLRLKCTGLNGSTEISAPDIYKEFIFVEEGNNTPLIRWSYSEDVALQQYKRTEFQYGIYNPANTVTDIMIELFSENNNTRQSRTVVPNNDTYSWFYYPTQGGSLPQTFSITTQDLNPNISASKELLVKPFEGADKIMAIEGVSFDFNPVGRTNYDANRNEYVFNGKNYLIPSENFDWANGGWIQENIGTTEEPQIVDAFLIKAGSSITLDYSPFEAAKSGESLNDMTAKNGKNMKFIFKTANCQTMTTPIMVCKGDNNTGLVINSQNAEIYYRPDASQPAIDLPYVEEEIIELEYNIESETHGRKPLLVSYISSDPSQAVTCELTPSGQSGQWTQDTPQKLVFGSEFCDVYLYRVKVYDRELSDAEIMQNYYADAFDGTTAYQRYSDNDILLENGDIDIEKLKQKYPELRILLVDCKDVWSNGKKDYREAYVEHYYPNGRLKDNWKANVRISIQGTSSVEYLTSAGNFDIDLRCKKIDNPREVGMKYLFEEEFYSKEELMGNPKIEAALVEELLETEYAMTDNSIPVNYINVKVNVASSESANNARLAEWYHNYNTYKRRARTYNDKIRDTMEFHPCVIFLRENAGIDNREFDNDGNYHFYACGDFGNSKENNNAFGMGEEAQYIVNELIANGEIDEAQREEKIAEYQAKECIVEVSNNIHDICRFKTAIFEDYQASYDDKKNEVVESAVWDGDAVEFRYCPDEDDTSIVKAETLKLWKWLYSVDAAAPGRNEVLISDVTRTEAETEIVYTFKTPIPYTDDFAITSIAPNFLFNITEGTSIQTFSKYDVEKFVTNYLKESFENHCRFYHSEDGCYEVELRLPKANLTYENFNGWTPKFFISFTSKYVLNWTNDSEFTISEVEDTAAYRNNKFKSEYTNFFEQSSLLYFYLFTERFTMIDNRAKNTFIHFDGLKWNYCFDYDNDTALGCNNRGYLTMDYGVEDIDNADGYPLTTHGGDPAFNANDSVVWVNVRNNLYSELQQAYNAGSLAWSSASMNKDFETYQNYKCNWLQMIDMRRKYLRPFTYGHGPSDADRVSEEKYLPMLQGRKTLQRRRYQKYQEPYFESKYTQTTTHNQFTFRAAYSEIGPVIVPYIKCYPIIDWDDASPYTQRTWPGEEYKTPKREIQNDLNFTIYPAKFISAVNGLNNAGVKSASMGNGIKLTDINLSDNPNLPSGENAKVELSGDQTLLTRLNLKNTGATIVPSLSELTNIRYINTENTKVTSIVFADGCLVEEAYLGNATEILSCVNNSQLQTLNIQQNATNQYNLKEVTINNPSVSINWTDLINTTVCPNLSLVQLLDVDYTTNSCWNVSFTYLDQLYQLKQNGKSIVISGKVYIDQIREHEYNKLIETWPGLEIDHPEFLPTYTVRFYRDRLEDGTLVPFNPPLECIYDRGVVAENPITAGLISTPVKDPDKNYQYTFIGWSHEFSAFNKDTDIWATYAKEDRKYTITWSVKRPSESVPYTLTYSDAVYGEDVVLEEMPNAQEILECIQYPDYYNNKHHLFSHWDKHTSYITENMVVNAVFEAGQAPIMDPDTLDTIDWNATTWYAVMQEEPELCTYNVKTGNRAKISFKQPDLINAPFIELIDKPLKFNGSTYVETEYKLNDTDWTLVVDAYCTEGTVLSATTRGGQGLTINASQSVMKPCWNGKESVFSINTETNLNEDGHRNIIVISHAQGSNDLYVAYGNISDLEVLEASVIGTQMSGDRPLILGAGRSTTGYNNYTTGTIYSCRLYNNFFGSSYRKQLAQWVSDDMVFDLTAHRPYSFNDEWTQVAQFNFTCAQSIFMPLKFSRKADGIAVNSTLYEWLEHRLYKAMPKPWQYILSTPRVNHLKGGTTYTINMEEDNKQHLWLPSFNELGGTGTTAKIQYQTEYNTNSLYSTNFSRVKYYGQAQITPDLVIDPKEYTGAVIPLTYMPTTRTDGSPLQNGDLWNKNNQTSASSTGWTIYHHGEWTVDADYEYWMRGTIVSGNTYGNFYNSSGNNGTQTYAGSHLRPVIPCFTIGKYTYND